MLQFYSKTHTENYFSCPTGTAHAEKRKRETSECAVPSSWVVLFIAPHRLTHSAPPTQPSDDAAALAWLLPLLWWRPRQTGPVFSMEHRLAEFRASRRTTANPKPAKLPSKAADPVTEEAQAQREESSQRTHSPKAHAVSSPLPWWTRYFLMNLTFLKFLLWLVLLGLFVELEFGLPYFVLSMFYWIYVGTRGPGEKQNGERSAYSVFNPGCEAIQGTLTAEQLERELHYRSLAER
ncbi:SAYSvFN domain-containing protein 1 [Heteronotia binoei]|uniref:SAYSvFN domain-containing protein 1 n=1 Tax=Heteronotia binoei TaxID=13085 RepID=UPI002930ADCB|nr:SAYSvFN domain-containing protein 1 [Heteronotia binoei]